MEYLARVGQSEKRIWQLRQVSTRATVSLNLGLVEEGFRPDQRDHTGKEVRNFFAV